MKRTTPKLQLELPGAADPALAQQTVENAIRSEMTQLAAWLADHGLDPRDEGIPTDIGSRDHLYWRSGYFTGLKLALEALTGSGFTRH
jgi:hypothetical protein